MAQPRLHGYLPLARFRTWGSLQAFIPWFASIYIRVKFVINTRNFFFSKNPWSAVSRPCEVNKKFPVHSVTLFQYLKTSLALVHSLYLLHKNLEVRPASKKTFYLFDFISGTRVHEASGGWRAKCEIFWWKFSLFFGPKKRRISRDYRVLTENYFEIILSAEIG